MNSKTLERKNSWINASFVTKILMWLTFATVLICACVIKLKDRLSFYKLADSQMVRLILKILRVLFRALIELIMGVLIFVGFSPALVGIAIIGFQVFVWLATETWTPIPLADAIETARVDLHLMDHSPLWPSMARGLRASLNEIPLSSCFVAAGLFLSACLAYIRCKLVNMLVVRS